MTFLGLSWVGISVRGDNFVKKLSFFFVCVKKEMFFASKGRESTMRSHMHIVLFYHGSMRGLFWMVTASGSSRLPIRMDK